MVFSIDQLVFMVEEYVRSGSFAKCRNKFAERFPDIAKVPNKSTIHRTVQRFRQTGSVLKKKRSSESSVLTKATLTVVKQCMDQTPRVSIKDLSKQCGLNRETCRRALIQLRADSDSVGQEKPNKQKRVEFCQFFNENYLGDPNLSELIFFSGEAMFHLSGEVVSLNSHHPSWFVASQPCNQNPTNDMKIGVWCAMSRRRIIGPIFFENTLNSSRYTNLVLKPFINELHDDEIQYGYFQQDEGSHHTSLPALQLLEEYYGDRVVSKGLWPPSSPDLSVTDFFLWSFLRSKCFESGPRTITALKMNITHIINNIPQSTLQSLSDNMNLRVQACLSVDGEEFQHMISM